MTNDDNNQSCNDFVVPHTFRRDDRIVIDDVEYVHDNTTPQGHTFRRYDDGLAEQISHERVWELISTGRMVIHPAWYHPGRAEIRQRVGGRRFDHLSEDQREKVLSRKEVCDRFLEREREERWVSRSDQKMRLVIREIMAEKDARNRTGGTKARFGQKLSDQTKGPDPSRLRAWLRDYERADFDIMALADNYRRPAYGSRLSDEAYAIHIQFARDYASRKKPSKAATYRRLESYIKEDLNPERDPEDQVELLSRRAFERFIDRMDPVYVYAGREGRDAARKVWRPSNGGLDVEAPFERIEMDEWYEDIQTVLTKWEVWQELPDDVRAKIPRARIWLSGAIDARTRVIPAVRFMTGQPTEGSAVSTLEMITLPMRDLQEAVGAATPFAYGTPQQVATDCGSSYINKGFQYRVLEIGADTVLPPAGYPEMRGKIERAFRTIKQRIIQHLSGRTFANVLEKGDQDPQAQAALVVKELNRLLVRGILDEYHNTPHDGLGGETPFNAFNRLSMIYGITPPPTGDLRRHVFGVPIERRIAQEGILVAGIRYQSPELQQLRREVRQKAVQVRVDRFDIGWISVWFPSLKGWLSVPARINGFEGVSFWALCDAIEKVKRDNHDATKLSAAVVRQAIRDRDERAKQAEREAGLDLGPMTDTAFEKIADRLFRNVRIHDDEADDGKGLGFGPAAEADESEDDFEASDTPVSEAADTPSETPPDSVSRTEAPDDTGDTGSHDDLLGTPDTGDDDDDDLFGDPDEWTST